MGLILSVGLKSLITGAGVGSSNPVTPWSVHVSKLPTKPDKVIAVYDTGGTNPEAAWLLDFRTAQVNVRGKPGGYTEAYLKIVDVKNVLLGIPAQQVNGEWYAGITGIGDITFIGNDKEDRPELVMNFKVIMEPADSALASRDPL